MQVSMEEQGGIVVIHLQGRLDYETVQPFHTTCLTQLAGRQVIFNMQQLDFVGSSGINSFLTTILELNKDLNTALKLCGVSSEFRRIFAASEVSHIEIYEDEAIARQAYAGAAVKPLNMPVPTLDEGLGDPLLEEFGEQLSDEHQIID
jgi:anti-anti-sigma factor